MQVLVVRAGQKSLAALRANHAATHQTKLETPTPSQNIERAKIPQAGKTNAED